jgi:GTPase SAR1 family protein
MITPPSTPKKWNVIFLVYARLSSITDDLDKIITKNTTNFPPPQGIPPTLPIEQELTYLFNDIIDAGESKDVGVFVIYNRVDIDNHRDRTALYQLQRQDGAGLVLQSINAVENSNITKPEIIISLFQETDKISPTEHHMLFTWDHGSIFGIAQGDNTQAALHADPREYQVISKHVDGTEQFVTLKGNQAYDRSWDNANKNRAPFITDVCNNMARLPSTGLVNEILTNEELAQAIALGFSNKVDVLVMMNCCMMNVNTIYALYKRSAVNYMIAPQSEINFPSYNYRHILREMYTHPEIEPFLLSRYVIQTLSQKRLYPRDYDFIYNTNFWAILCVDVTQFESVLSIITELIPELTTLIETPLYQKIKIQLDFCYRFDSYRQGLSDYMIDLRTFLFLCKDYSPKLYLLHGMLEHHLNSFIIDSFIGPLLFDISYPTSIYNANLKPSGISAFFPRTSGFIHPEIFQTFIAENAVSRSSFFSDTKWLDLICKFISH